VVHVRRGRDFARRGAIEPLLRKDVKRRAENQLTRLVVRAGGGRTGGATMLSLVCSYLIVRSFESQG
jgi:hypothetical protein